MTVLGHNRNQYQVIGLVARAPSSNLYICQKDDRQFLLQIASDQSNNSKVDLAAFILSDLSKTATLYEGNFQKKFPGQQLNYNWLFPHVEDSFKSIEQGGRIVNILSIDELSKIDKIVPLSNILNKDRRTIDLATSVWVMGRMLKLLVYTHDQNISIKLNGDNILIEPYEHRVVIIDWTQAEFFQGLVPEALKRTDIASAAKTILIALGEYERKGRYCETQYVEFLNSLLNLSGEIDTEKIYHEFEASHAPLLDRNMFYDFTTFSI